MLKRRKNLIAILAVLAAFSLCLGGPEQVGAQPLEIEMAVRIPGPPLVLIRPLELSLDQRMSAQQIIWECRQEEELRAASQLRRSTRAQDLSDNPFPVLSAFLTDAYRAVNS
jgi:hypothetical protein